MPPRPQSHTQVEIERTGLLASTQIEQEREAYRATQAKSAITTDGLRVELRQGAEARDKLTCELEQTYCELRQARADLAQAGVELREQQAMFNAAIEAAANRAVLQARQLETQLVTEVAKCDVLRRSEESLNASIAHLHSELKQSRNQASQLEQVRNFACLGCSFRLLRFLILSSLLFFC